MDKREIYQYLTEQGVHYEVTEHKAVFNMEDVEALDMPYPNLSAKNLFVCDRKKNYYLITTKGNKRVNLKAFWEKNGLNRLSFASPDDLKAILNLIPGAVTPLGLLNDEHSRVRYFLDAELMGSLMGVHPNDNTATVWMQVEDLVNLIRQHGNEVNIVEI